MKKHQISFLLDHGDSGHIHDMLDAYPGKFFPSLEHNPAYDVTHLRKEIGRAKSGAAGSVVHRTYLHDIDHDVKDVDDLMDIQRYQVAQTSPHFGPEHMKRMLSNAHHQISAYSWNNVPIDDELHRRIFVDEEADWGRPKYHGLQWNKAHALSRNPTLNQDAFDKLFDADESNIADLVRSHPDKVKPHHIQQILELDNGRRRSGGYNALVEKGFIK